MINFIIFLTLLISRTTLGYTEVSNIDQCQSCIKDLNKIVCRDEKSDSMSYCCDATETGRACTGRDFCSS